MSFRKTMLVVAALTFALTNVLPAHAQGTSAPAAMAPLSSRILTAGTP